MKAHCNKCFCDTNHLIVAERTQRDAEKAHPNDPEDKYFVEFITKYTMLECCGCETVTMRQRYFCSEWPRGEFDETFYPPRVSRQLPHWYKKLPKEMRELLEEVYAALHNDNRRLAIMGTRAIVDLYMNDKLGDIGGFTQKLKALVSEGYISQKSKNILGAALGAGDAATHRGYKANPETVKSVIDIVENLIQGYVLDIAAEDIKKVTPIRKRSN